MRIGPQLQILKTGRYTCAQIGWREQYLRYLLNLYIAMYFYTCNELRGGVACLPIFIAISEVPG